MGKKQHSKDRMYITRTEWATEWGGNKDRDLRTPFKRLPFYCCGVSFTPFEDPVCSPEGHVFDIIHIVPYLQKHHRNPVTGKPLEPKDLIKLNYHKNTDGEYQCPVLGKVFTEFTHIVAVKPTGNVYCYEAIRELNIKPKNWKDLLTDAPFTRNDLITLQDPNALDQSRVLSEFDHVKTGKRKKEDTTGLEEGDPEANIRMSEDQRRIFEALKSEEAKEEAALGGGGAKARQERAAAQAAAKARAAAAARDGVKATEERPAPLSIVDAASASVSGRSAASARAETNAEKTHARVAIHTAGDRTLIPENTKSVVSRYTSGAVSRSFTSSAWEPTTKSELQVVAVERNPKKKGYVRLSTTHGDLNLEMHCDMAPRACENFITLCDRGYYNNVIFHRNIKNFMIQGGDPTGTGTGGESIWKKPFKDEFHSKLLHSGRGVISLANSGPHTNGSQFFILYKSAPHLNNKHTVFGTVVGGMETLSRMERVLVDEEDRPVEEIRITSTSVFVNPYTEPDEEELEERRKAEEAATKEARYEEDNRHGQWFSNPTFATDLKPHREGVGKYLRTPEPSRSQRGVEATGGEQPPAKGRKKGAGVNFGDFSGW